MQHVTTCDNKQEVKLRNIFSKDSTVDVFKGSKLNVEHIIKIDELHERSALNIRDEINKTQKNSRVVIKESSQYQESQKF